MAHRGRASVAQRWRPGGERISFRSPASPLITSLLLPGACVMIASSWPWPPSPLFDEEAVSTVTSIVMPPARVMAF